MVLLALEEARVETVVCRLQQLDNGRGLRDIFDAQRASASKRGFEHRVQAMMHRLTFRRTDATESYGGRQHTADAEMEERRECFVAGHTKRARDEAKRRCEVTVELVARKPCAGLDERVVAKAACGNIEQRTALGPAGACGDVTP